MENKQEVWYELDKIPDNWIWKDAVEFVFNLLKVSNFQITAGEDKGVQEFIEKHKEAFKIVE